MVPVMRMGGHRRASLLRCVLPVLAIVWATLTWHDCYLYGMNAGEPVAAVEHCEHQHVAAVDGSVTQGTASDDPPAGTLPSCDDLGEASADSRASTLLLHAAISSFHASPMATSPALSYGPVARVTTQRPPDTPLHLRPARLLI